MSKIVNQALLRRMVSLLAVVAVFFCGIGTVNAWENNNVMGFEVFIDVEPLESEAGEDLSDSASVLRDQSLPAPLSLSCVMAPHDAHNNFLDYFLVVRAPPVTILFS